MTLNKFKVIFPSSTLQFTHSQISMSWQKKKKIIQLTWVWMIIFQIIVVHVVQDSCFILLTLKSVSFTVTVLLKIAFCPPLLRKRGDIKSHSSVCQSVCHKNFNLGNNFCTITGRALIFGMCVLCNKTFPMVPCRDLDGDLWPTLRSNLLQSRGPQFSEFACWDLLSGWGILFHRTLGLPTKQWLIYIRLYHFDAKPSTDPISTSKLSLVSNIISTSYYN